MISGRLRLHPCSCGFASLRTPPCVISLSFALTRREILVLLAVCGSDGGRPHPRPWGHSGSTKKKTINRFAAGVQDYAANARTIFSSSPNVFRHSQFVQGPLHCGGRKSVFESFFFFFSHSALRTLFGRRATSRGLISFPLHVTEGMLIGNTFQAVITDRF